jgi:4-methyl-5(b-hydroxyethyl)-thiazole monophosphate biosynthesis
MKTVLVPIATGFEEIEAVGIIDVLRRAGIKVIVSAVSKNITVQGANGIIIQADNFITDINCNDIDMIVLPGGWGGTDVLVADQTVQTMIKELNSKQKLVGAICAAPYALHTAGVLSQNYTCYPSVEEKIRQDGYKCNKKVVKENNIITSQGPATAICFALEIVKELKGIEMYEELKSGLLADFC